MVGTTLKMLVDENASEKYNTTQAKKLTVPTNEATTKRAAFGDLQNRGHTRILATKDGAQKDLKDIKARVDTHWKKQPLGTSNAQGTTATALTRTNSIRTNANALRPRQASNTLQTGLATAAASKPKSGSDDKINTLRREDSNLSEKSLTKLRAALAKSDVTAAKKELREASKDAPVNVVKPLLKPNLLKAVTKSSTTVSAAAATTTTAAGGLLKKEPVLNVLPMSPNRLNKLRRQPVVTAPTIPGVQSALSVAGKRLVEVEDIDVDDHENLILVSEYVNDIYDYLYELEEQQPIHKNHLSNHLDVSYKMRSVLIDWINEVHLQFHLAAETFHLAVAIIDRYLQVAKNTKRKYLQLVGVTALFIATKYEELFPPAIGDFVFITDDTYTGQEIRQMELQILKAIDNNLSRPLPIHFLRRYSKAACAEDAHHGMSKYFLELAAMDYDLASYKPSEIAAASLFLSLHLLNGNARTDVGFNDKHWTPTLEHYSHYTAKHLRAITKQIAKLAREAPTAKLRAVFNKYQSNKFQNIALRSELRSKLLESIAGISKK